jgi:integrase
MARGTIIKRKKRTGGVTYDIKFRTRDGRQVKKAIGPSRREAERALTLGLQKADRGENQSSSRETFADAADRWLARKRPLLEQSTYEDYDRHLRLRLVPTFGKRKLRDITRAHIDDYVTRQDRAGTLSRKTVNDSLIPLRQILGRAVAEGAIAKNLAVTVDRDDPVELPYERPTMRYLNRDEARRYLAACPSWYRLLAETLIGAGLRIGEALALEWTDIDWDNCTISVTKTVKVGGVGTPKGDRARTVAVASYLIDSLRQYRLDQSRITGRVFVAPEGGELTRQAARRRGHIPTLRAAGLPSEVRLHDLRHSAASIWLAAGESIYFCQQQLGHQDIQTTISLYGHPDQMAHRQAAERAAAWWRTGVSEDSPVPPAVPRPLAAAAATPSDPLPTRRSTP